MRAGAVREGAGAAADAVTRLARAEEAASYGRAAASDVVDPELGAALRTARRGLLRSVSRDVRLRARLWPASLVAGAGTRLTDRARRPRWARRPAAAPSARPV